MGGLPALVNRLARPIYWTGSPSFSTGGGEFGLAFPRAVDKSELESQLCYWHITAETLKDHMSNPAAISATARRVMVLSQLRPQGVTDAAVLGAMAAVPREDYLPAKFAAVAYGDRPLRLDDGAPVMAPAELGQLLTQLAPKAGERALVIGGGGDYSAAILRHIGLPVDTATTAEEAPTATYDIILIEGAVERTPAALAKQLAAGGRIGAAIVEDKVTRLATGRGDGKSLGFTSFAEAQVPLLASFSRAPAFTF